MMAPSWVRRVFSRNGSASALEGEAFRRPSPGRRTIIQDPSGAEIRSAETDGLLQFIHTYSWLGGSPLPYRIQLEMAKHSTIRMATAAVTKPLRALGYEISCRDPEIRAFTDAVIDGLWIRLKQAMFGLGHPHGWVACEKVFEERDLEATPRLSSSEQQPASAPIRFTRKWVLKRLHDLSPDRSVTWPVFRPDGTFDGVKNRPQLSDDAVKLDPEKVLVFTPERYGGNLLGRAAYETAYRPWYRDKILWHLWMMHLEKRGIPQIKGRAPDEEREDPFNPGKKRNGLLILEDLLRGGLHGEPYLLPHEIDEVLNKAVQKWDIEILQSDPRGDLFERAVAAGEVAMVHAILEGPAKAVLQGTGRTGTFAETRVHADLYQDCLQAIADTAESDLNEYLIPQVVGLNFPNPPPCRIKLEKVRSVDRELLMAIAPVLLKSQTVVAGRKLPAAALADIVAVLNRYGVQINRAALAEDAPDLNEPPPGAGVPGGALPGLEEA